ncbi:3-hydroxybutyrate dehydrogenase [Actinoplanes tereljensis]|uniref:3-hydroxybutyrate dehydrogenase n=1 Tax=Paractinoplanes tereljensis TaxID=571912 RepID=A0A919NWT8_9ACTN|nr:SDR family NAD(P)-dependent oxidoreductase [Actinoplanes tereljensis]GIF25798.1 3-hydroxybutyrate dehydrogenase [Actinoplanes tereljensis]
MTTAHVVDLDLSGKTALVTGGGSGIGRACAERLAAAGAKVVVVDLQAGPDTIVTDLSDLDAIGALPAGVDVLVNNAGLQVVSPLHEFPDERFSLIQKVMVEAPYRLVKHVLPHMYERGWGRIINISSVHGLIASPYKSAYVTAKHGLEGLSKVTALEGAPHGVTSNCICPAFVRTPLVDKQIADQAQIHGISESEVVEKIMLDRAAIKRLIEPAEVAELLAYLCTPPAALITGSSITIDGGWTAH